MFNIRLLLATVSSHFFCPFHSVLSSVIPIVHMLIACFPQLSEALFIFFIHLPFCIISVGLLSSFLILCSTSSAMKKQLRVTLVWALLYL